MRVALFFGLLVAYGCFWMAFSLCLSVVCRQPETSLVLGVLAWVLAAAVYPQVAGWTASRMAPAIPGEFEQFLVAAPVEDSGYRDRLVTRRNALSRQYRQYRRLAAVLPVTALLDAGQAVAGTSVADHEQFLRNVDGAERSFEAWQARKLARHPRRDRTVVLGEPLDIDGLPAPVYEPLPMDRSLGQAALPAGTLLLGAAALLGGAVLGFDRLDVR